jgi:FkbM family methyltransferase
MASFRVSAQAPRYPPRAPDQTTGLTRSILLVLVALAAGLSAGYFAASPSTSSNAGAATTPLVTVSSGTESTGASSISELCGELANVQAARAKNAEAAAAAAQLALTEFVGDAGTAAPSCTPPPPCAACNISHEPQIACPSSALCPVPTKCPSPTQNILSLPAASASPVACPADHGAAVRANLAQILAVPETDNTLGFADARLILSFLWRFFLPNGGPRMLLIDIGANVGDTSSAFQGHFSQADCFRYEKNMAGVKHDSCTDWPARVIAYEPMPANYQILVDRARDEGWVATGWRGYKAAVTSTMLGAGGNGEAGSVKFYADDTRGIQQGALSSSAGASGNFFIVEAWTLDAHLASIGENNAEILLLKVDAEGFDGHVLVGAEATLRSGHVSFIVFEYNSKWATGKTELPWSLGSVVAWLLTVKYECYFITPSDLIPISGSWWDPGFEIWRWSNVFCHQVNDSRGQRLVSFYNLQRPVSFGC